MKRFTQFLKRHYKKVLLLLVAAFMLKGCIAEKLRPDPYLVPNAPIPTEADLEEFTESPAEMDSFAVQVAGIAEKTKTAADVKEVVIRHRTYYEGEYIDSISGIKVIFSDGTEEEIDMLFDGFITGGFAGPGENTIEVTCKYGTYSYEVPYLNADHLIAMIPSDCPRDEIASYAILYRAVYEDGTIRDVDSWYLKGPEVVDANETQSFSCEYFGNEVLAQVEFQ